MAHIETKKQNFILWYKLCNTERELEMVRSANKEVLNRLLKEYANEVDRVDRTKYLFERINRQKTMEKQDFDGELTIDDATYEVKSHVYSE